MNKIAIFLSIFLLSIFRGNLLAGDCPFKFEKAKSNPDSFYFTYEELKLVGETVTGADSGAVFTLPMRN